ncbi:asparaginase [Curtobacterium ammoniigenes]|uniref:asparaginase n=1 Tax=Curtobacterium ammoniigenes TaxID=395387 RepID=UPI0008306C44|nr:asparaginase [Curtobacterium ammoniigenes]
MAHSELPHVAVASLGGTITMTGTGGVRPTLTAADLVAAVPGVADLAQLDAVTLATVPGASLRLADLERALRWAQDRVTAGATGVVIAQGTDTIEETAYWLHLHWDVAAPLVITGAMRPPAAASADGPANLLAAVAVAADAGARNRGVLVVLDQQIHAAALVRKQSTTALNAFQSPTAPLGAVNENRVVFFSPAHLRTVLSLGEHPARVAAIGTGIDDDGSLIDAAAAAGVDGIVIAAFGAGHLPERVADAAAQAARTIPVVIASRTGSSRTLRATYGFPGSEQDLSARGLLLAAWLDPAKARILLAALLQNGLQGTELRKQFNAYADPFASTSDTYNGSGCDDKASSA